MGIQSFVDKIFDEKLEELRTDISGLKSEMEEFKEANATERKSIKGRLDKVEIALGDLRILIDGLSAQMTKIQNSLKPGSNTTTSSPERWEPRTAGKQLTPANQKPERPITLYAQGKSNGVLMPVPEAYADTVPFVITATGDKGIVSFNERSVAKLISSIEARLIPYFECEILSSTPRTIRGINTVNATRSGDNWILDGKIKLTIS